jgi:acyl transferase domain-containing protein/acyl carrier protein
MTEIPRRARATQRKRASRREAPRPAIAIIGMAGRFPGAADVRSLWNNVLNGVESVSVLSDEELRDAGIGEELIRNAAYVKVRGIVDGIDLFDAGLFGFNPREAELLDPQHRLMLEVAWHTLEHAGYDPLRYEGAIGVFAGATHSLYYRRMVQDRALLPDIDSFDAEIANVQDSLATRISYKLNLKGPSLTVGTYCSTSAVAIHLACQSIRSGESDMALAGGVSLHVPSKHGHLFQPGNQGSPDGHTRAFDERARGTVFCDAVAMLLLKRLDDAMDDGDTVYGVIRGSAVNNDGSLKFGFTAPSVERQSEVIVSALEDAGLTADDIHYVEAHGTATELGDPIEVTALTRAFRQTTAAKQFCALGSIKTNIGHADRAAGIVGVIKALHVLKYGLVPPTLHFEKPNPKLDLPNSPFFVNNKVIEFPASASPRRSGVTSLGVGGTNVHIVLEESPRIEATGPGKSWHFLPLSAKTAASLEKMRENLALALEEQEGSELADVAFTLQSGRRELGERMAVVGRNRDEVIQALRDPDSGRTWRNLAPVSRQPLIFLFPDAAEHYQDMAAGLCREIPGFRLDMNDCFERLKVATGVDSRTVPEPCQIVVEYCLARLLMSWGLLPAAVFGCGSGELAAMAVAGILSLSDACRLALDPRRRSLIDAEFHTPGVRYLSNATGNWIGDDEAVDPQYWAQNLGKTTRLGACLDKLAEERWAVLEVGPGEARAEARNALPVVSTLRRADTAGDDMESLTAALAALWVSGTTLDWSAYYAGERRRRVALPCYVFDRQRYWIDKVVQERASLAGQLFGDGERARLEESFYVPSWSASGAARRELPARGSHAGECWLIFVDGDGVGDALARLVRPLGIEVIQVRRAASYAALANGSFQVGSSRKEDYLMLLDEIKRRGRVPGRIVHLWGTGFWQEGAEQAVRAGLDVGFYSLFYLTQAIGDRFADVPLQLCIVSSDLEPVLTGEGLCALKATLKGPCKVIRQEYANIACRSIDLGSMQEEVWSADELARRLAVEIVQGGEEQFVAFRQGLRWTPTLERLSIDAPLEGTPRLREAGVYLITGGLGGIGLALAEFLHRNYRAKLVLVGRSHLPPREQWEKVCAGGGDDRTRERVRKLKSLVEAGADVLLARADVTDREQMRAAVEQAVARFGGLNGVFHAAGLPGQGLTQFKSARAAAQVMAPKIQGTLVLDDVLSGMSLDFLILVSSVAALSGGGPGQIEYCACNAFLDSFAHSHRRKHGMTVSIDFGEWQWDAWSERLQGYQPEVRAALVQHRRKFGLTFEEGMEAIRRILSIDIPQIIVSPEDAVAMVAGSNACTVAHLFSIVQQQRERHQKSYPRSSLSSRFAAASNDVERAIATIWQQVLGIDEIGRQDNFFELGGNSLVGLQVIARINRDLGLAMEVSSIFELPTVAALAEMIRAVQQLAEDGAADADADQPEEVV